MINRHNPYPTILTNLYSINNISEELMTKSLQDTKKYIKSLRRSYSSTPCNVDYSNKYLKGAYMLAYFPYYIETVHRVLDDLEDEELSGIFEEELNVCFFGAGPAPELLGVLSYLDLHQTNVSKVNAYLFDAATEWEMCRTICTDSMAPNYWKGELEVNAVLCDLVGCDSCDHDSCEEVIPQTRLFVMQNCLNDIVEDTDTVINNFRHLFEKINAGSVFLILDLNFESVRQLLKGIQQDIVNNNLGEVLSRVSPSCDQYQPRFSMPDELLENTFDGTDGAIPRKYTKYYSLVLRRK